MCNIEFFLPCDKFCITLLLVAVKRLFSEIDHLSAHPSNLINAVRWLIDWSVGVAPSLRSNFVSLDFESQQEPLDLGRCEAARSGMVLLVSHDSLLRFEHLKYLFYGAERYIFHPG